MPVTTSASPSSLPGAALDGVLPWHDLTAMARDAGLAAESPFDGDPTYEATFDALCRALRRSVPRHVLLVRERGVGEQGALVELARRGLLGRPPFLRERRFISVDCRRVPSEDARGVVAALFGEGGAAGTRPDIVLCVDGLVPLMRGGGGRDGGDARAAVMSALAGCAGRAVVTLDPHEHAEAFAADADAQELFSVVHLPEPDLPVATRLVRHYAAGLAAHYRVAVTDAAVRRAVELSAGYILNERLPFKAVKVLRAICDDVEYDRTQLGRGDAASVDEPQVIAKVSDVSGVPADTLAGVGERADYQAGLSDVVVGQDHAVREVATELGLIKAGLVDPGKPASVMMFIGQTGTGKTELAKALARLYSSSKRLKTFTLGNFSEPHSVSGLIGVPPGYVGHDQGGRLVNELLADPYGVFLLDEADKAHPDVMQPFLNLFDEGWVYDQRGVRAYADRAIFILTTNVGQRQIAEMCKQGKPIDEVTATMKEQLSRIRHTKSNRPVFTPEFIARVKRLIVFRSLDAAAMSGICRRLVADMAADWRRKRRRELRVADGLLDAVAARAHALDRRSQGKEGGRIVRKLLSDLMESRIQRAIGEDPDAYRACAAVEVEYDGPPVLAPEAAAAAEPPNAKPVDIVVPDVDPAAVRVRFAAGPAAPEAGAAVDPPAAVA